MNIKDAQLLISAVKEEQYPNLDLDEYVLLGRSNVGKSSFINTLINRKNLARTSSQPGKTQTMNFYHIQAKPDIVFVDMPGYGYAKASKKDRQKWGQMIEHYLLNRDKIKEVFLLVDSRVGPTEDDKLMYDWLKYYNFNPVIIATKTDKLPKTKIKAHLNKIQQELKLLPEDKLIAFSTTTKSGKEDVWEIIEEN